MSRKFILLAGFSMLAFAQPVVAQEAAASDEASPSGGLEEIVVTAQKREQNLQDVPVSVTALSAAALENQRINAFADLARAAPSLTISEGTNTNNSTIYLRGIGTNAFSISAEPSVLVVIDDVATVQQAQAFNGLADIGRVEVLRGPQGTLFGKNASAGVVNIVTKGPSDHFTAGLQLTGTTDEEIRVEGSISGPLGDQGSGFRVNAFLGNRRGNITNLTNGNDLNNDESYGVRAKLDLKLSSAFKVRLIGDYSKQEQRGTARTYRRVSATALSSFLGGYALTQQLTGITPGEDNYNVRYDTDPVSNSETKVLIGKMSLDLGAAELTSISAYQDWKYTFTEDVDGTELRAPGSSIPIVSQGGPFHAKQFSEELRLTSTGHGPLGYLIGAYYADSTTTRTFERGPVAAFVAKWDAEATNKSYAGFAQLDYRLTDTTKVSGGVRVGREDIGVVFTRLNAPLTAANCGITCTGTSGDTAVTAKFSLQQDVAPDVMVFANVSTGYKGPGYDVASGFTPAKALTPVLAERSNAYELGIKSRFLDNRVQLNLTGFWTDYRNYQAQAAVITSSGAIQLGLNNVGKLRTKGLELELSAKPFDGLRIDGSASYVDAKIREFPTADCYPGQTVAATGPGCHTITSGGSSRNVQDLAGANLANAPRFKFNIGGVYDFPLSGEFGGFVGVTYQHQSSVNFDLFQNPLTVQEAYGVLDANIGIKSGDPDHGFKITAFVNNLFDKRYVSNIGDARSTYNGVVLVQSLPRNSQRYFGVRLKYQY